MSSRLRASAFFFASASNADPFRFRHVSRSQPLNDRMRELSLGVAGREKSISAPRSRMLRLRRGSGGSKGSEDYVVQGIHGDLATRAR